MKSIILFASVLISTTTFASTVFVTDADLQEKLKEAGINATLVATTEAPAPLKKSAPRIDTPIHMISGYEFYMQIDDIFVGQVERDESDLAVKRWSLVKATDHLFAVAITAEKSSLAYMNFQNGKQTDAYLYNRENQAIVLRNGISGSRFDFSATCRANGPEFHSKDVLEMPCDEVRSLEFNSPQMVELLVKGIRQLKAQQVGELD